MLTSRALQRWDCVGEGKDRTMGLEVREVNLSRLCLLFFSRAILNFPKPHVLFIKWGLLCSLDIGINQKWPPSDCKVLPSIPSITTTTKPGD